MRFFYRYFSRVGTCSNQRVETYLQQFNTQMNIANMFEI